MRDSVILGGNSHPELLQRICRDLDVQPAEIHSSLFANGETNVSIAESVREKTVYVVQSACGEVNDAFMELLIMISACKAASAKSVVAVMPLFPYSRQLNLRDALNVSSKEASKIAQQQQPFETPLAKKPSPRLGDLAQPPLTPVRTNIGMNISPVRPCFNRQLSVVAPPKEENVEPQYNPGFKCWMANPGELMARLLTTAGADRIITMDLHDPQYQGFFDIPVDNLYGRPLLEQYIATKIPDWRHAVIVSPDAGGAKRATSIADHLGMDFALIHKDGRNNATLLVGDVAGKVVILLDDLVDSGKTMTRAAKVVKDHGATMVYGICTHGVFSGDALHRLKKSINCFVTTNSVPQHENQAEFGEWIQVVDVAHVLAEAIRRIHNGESISMLFDHAVGVV